ncbi:DUF6360 family protein [Natronobiforma cellulositropha]|uniref:DUF6360 family protein n=1 Tax=Natronobiforma cellulositropha TaxID=1679076 RepID=UPI0021D5A836|nr:DUF6360 family protein [Natronobiforma cellulositropha]
MPRRLLSVTAYTTLEYVESVVTGHDFETETVAVLDVTSDRDDPDCVHLKLEADNLSERHLPAHMERLELTPEQARAIAADLEKHAERVENADGQTEDG